MITPRAAFLLLASCPVWSSLAPCGHAASGNTAEPQTLTFQAGDRSAYSVSEDVNVVQSKQADSIARFWTRRQPNAAVDRYYKGTSDAFYLIRLPKLLGIKSRQVPRDPDLIVNATLRLVRVPTPGYFPEGWPLPPKKKLAFTVYRLTDPDGRQNIYCRGFLVDVEPEDGGVEIEPGDVCIIHAARSGDELVLVHRTVVKKEAPNRYCVSTTAPKLTITLPAPEGQETFRYQDRAGATRVVRGQPVRTSRGDRALAISFDAGELKQGRATIELQQ